MADVNETKTNLNKGLKQTKLYSNKIIKEGKGRYSCLVCFLKSSRYFNVTRHYMRFHEKSVKLYASCCGINFQTKANYYDHQALVHKKIKRYSTAWNKSKQRMNNDSNKYNCIQQNSIQQEPNGAIDLIQDSNKPIDLTVKASKEVNNSTRQESTKESSQNVIDLTQQEPSTNQNNVPKRKKEEIMEDYKKPQKRMKLIRRKSRKGRASKTNDMQVDAENTEDTESSTSAHIPAPPKLVPQEVQVINTHVLKYKQMLFRRYKEEREQEEQEQEQ